MCDREASDVVVVRDAAGRPTVFCDPCIAPIVKALNDAGVTTVASCCGHGEMPPTVALTDGRELVIANTPEERDIMRDSIAEGTNS